MNGFNVSIKPWLIGLLEAIGVLAYIALFSALTQSTLFFSVVGQNPMYSIMTALMLLVFSALVCGTLVLGVPLLELVKGNRSSALRIFAWSGLWLLAGIAAVLVVMFFWK